MFLGKTTYRKDSEIPTASLADIVFLLLVFFLVVTSIDTEKGINLLLPYEETPGHDDLILCVYVNDQDKIAIEGDQVSLNDVKTIVQENLAVQPKLIVSLKTGQKTHYQNYISVLEKIKEGYGNKNPKISIVTSEE